MTDDLIDFDEEAETEFLIVGAGITGLAIADALVSAGRNVLMIEGRERVGGRVLTDNIAGARVDLGPAWFWPGQPRIAALITDLGLQAFEQFSTGRLVFEGPDGGVRRDLNMVPMAGSLRAADGLSAVAHGMTRRIGADRI